MIRITGDTHGEQARFLYSAEEKTWGADDYIIVAGDWGFLFFDNYAENMFLNDLETRPYTMCFVDGNHENFPAIHSYPVEDWNGGKIHRIRKNIMHLMRGQVYTIEGRIFFTMGGAYSTDRWRREKDISYWDEELPCDAEYKEALRNLKAHGNTVDYIITHTAPERMIRYMGMRPDPNDAELTGFLEYLRETVRHKHWYCGHWHRDTDLTEQFTVLYRSIQIIE